MHLSSTSLILVAVLPTPRDLELARLLGWYRIPLRRAPKVIAVDYVAFYQPASFGLRGGQVEYVAPVRGHELTTRAEILRDQLDHPRAREEYYKIQLGELITLPRPIPAGKWRRITFFYTTGEYFLQAKTINELVVRSEDRKVLWKTLRERAIDNSIYQSNDLPELPIEPDILMLLGIFGDSRVKENLDDYD